MTDNPNTADKREAINAAFIWLAMFAVCWCVMSLAGCESKSHRDEHLEHIATATTRIANYMEDHKYLHDRFDAMEKRCDQRLDALEKAESTQVLPADDTHSVLVLPPETEKRIADLEKLTNELGKAFVSLHDGCEKQIGGLDKRVTALEKQSHTHKPRCKK